MTDREILELLLKEMAEMKKDIKQVKQDVTSIQLHLENVTDKNIQTVAEGHLDLSTINEQI